MVSSLKTETNSHLCSNVLFSLENALASGCVEPGVSGHVHTLPDIHRLSKSGKRPSYLELPLPYVALCLDLLGQISVTWEWRNVPRSQTGHLSATCLSSTLESSVNLSAFFLTLQ